MRKTFVADVVSCETRRNLVTVGLADETSSPVQYVLISRDIAPAQQDRELGHDRIYVEVDGQAQAGYGMLDLVRLNNHQLTIFLGGKFASNVGFDEVVVTFEVSPWQLRKLKECLSTVACNYAQLEVDC